jgi:hypothetical protein
MNEVQVERAPSMLVDPWTGEKRVCCITRAVCTPYARLEKSVTY